jgi:hypothetical protein
METVFGEKNSLQILFQNFENGSLPNRSPEQWLVVALQVGRAVRMKIGEIGSTESVGCGARQISSPGQIIDKLIKK